ncbi:hypothetical protein K0M31_012527 [Melipona bicolor]|uniref:Uncharacterized protein n=1 Tax=Melipona bicolor TaxID=60889 RepID=A0AA40KH70_9HYME|nr:hypothetical protein K0M31_012527 [Melipona bicolor]
MWKVIIKVLVIKLGNNLKSSEFIGTPKRLGKNINPIISRSEISNEESDDWFVVDETPVLEQHMGNYGSKCLMDLEQENNNKGVYSATVICNILVKIEPAKANRNPSKFVLGLTVNVTGIPKTIATNDCAICVKDNWPCSATRVIASP